MGAQKAAKHLVELGNRLGSGAQIQYGVSGAVITNVGQRDMELMEEGAIAATQSDLHYIRKGWRGARHVSIGLDSITKAELATLRIADGVEAESILLETNEAGSPWAILTTDEQRQFLLEKFAESNIGGLRFA